MNNPTVDLDVGDIKSFRAAASTPGSYSFTLFNDKQATRLITTLRRLAEAQGFRVVHVVHSAQFYSFDVVGES